MNKFAAFLRGINVGGNNKIRMADLKKAFESSGFKNVKTILASGNVIFETTKSDIPEITEKIQNDLKKEFRSEISVIIRPVGEIIKLFKKEPFGKINVTPQTRLYVTFLPAKIKKKIKTPFSPEDENFTIVLMTGQEICSVLALTPDNTSLDLMGYIEKNYGRKVTTRNWNTIKKILDVSTA